MDVFNTSDLIHSLNEFEQKHCPDRLYVDGNTALLTSGRRVSVVGSRKPSPDGLRRARAFTQALVRHDIIVVSGLAAGIDTAAHQTAIEFGGKTVAVLGTPLSKAYPAQNAGLLAEIKRNHLAISQFPEGFPAKRTNFPQRNRTMALVTDATVIIEASENSGTRSQGWETLRLGRLLFLMENVANDSSIGWAREMISYGAQVLSRDTLSDALLELPHFTEGGELAF